MIGKPHWQQGTRLGPQHLQVADRYHEEQLVARLAVLDPFAWGVVDVDVDQHRLQRDELVVRSVVAVMPDGTPVEHAEGPEVAPLQLRLDTLPAGSMGEACLAMPPRATGEHAMRRFRVETRTVADLQDAGPPATIAFAMPDVQLRWAHEVPAGWTTLPLVRVGRQQDGRVFVDAHYIPPIVQVRAAGNLVAELRRLHAAVLAKQAHLQTVLAQGSSVDGVTALRRCIITALAPFGIRIADLLERPTERPLAAYKLLLELNGVLSTIDPQRRPLLQIAFVYNRLGDVLLPLITRAIDVLDSLQREPYRVVPLQSQGNGLFYANLSEPGIFSSTFYLVSSECRDGRVLEQLARVMKAAAWEDLQGFAQAGVQGIALVTEPRAPSQLPQRDAAVYLRLEPTGQAWESAVRRGNLAFYLPVGSDQMKLELFALRAQEIL